MKKWIRWSGLAAFIVIVAVLGAGWYFAAAPLIKLSIEKLGSQAAGAKVEVEKVNLTFDPLGIQVQGIDVADADKPMENLISIDQAVADVALIPMLMGKGIVEELSLSGVRFGTARTTSGALPKEKSEEKPKDEPASDAAQLQASTSSATKKNANANKNEPNALMDGLKNTLPSADEVLEREPLATVTEGKAFQSAYSYHKTNIDETVAKVPNAAALKDYETRLNKIVNGKYKSLEDFKQRKKEFEALKKQFKQDKEAVAAAEKAIKDGKNVLTKQWNALSSAPESDYNKLISKYKLDGVGASNLSALLFGQQAGEWAKQGLYYYEKVRPLLVSSEEDIQAEKERERAKGRYVGFKTDRPLPDFWIKKMQFTGQLPAGDILVKAVDITHQQSVINKPTRLTVSGEKLAGLTGFNLAGVLDHRTETGKDSFELKINQAEVKNKNLGMAGLKMNHSQVEIQAKALVEGDQILADGTANFTQSKFSTKDRTVVAKELNNALARIPVFDLTMSAKGDLLSPKVGFNSDLDNKLEKIFNQTLNEKLKDFEDRLKKGLEDKLLSYAGDYKDTLKQMNLTSGNLKDAEKKLTNLAKAKLADYKDQKQKELDKKVKEKQKDLEKKAKDKLKDLFGG